MQYVRAAARIRNTRFAAFGSAHAETRFALLGCQRAETLCLLGRARDGGRDELAERTGVRT